ncbi:1090_t:CDS:1, partial [Scutellospora calospora]
HLDIPIKIATKIKLFSDKNFKALLYKWSDTNLNRSLQLIFSLQATIRF